MRVIWAVATLPGQKWTDLQYKLLIASIRSFRATNPGYTTVLYASGKIYNILKEGNCLGFWDEYYVLSLSSSKLYTPWTWDYPKVEALSIEENKVLYVDYDIVFHRRLYIREKNQYCLYPEMTTGSEAYYGVEDIVPFGLNEKLVRTDIAYNSAILYLDKDVVSKWKELYLSIVPYSFGMEKDYKNHTRFTLTIGQACLVPIVGIGKIKYLGWEQGNAFTHFLGPEKSNNYTKKYRYIDNIVEKMYPTPKELVSVLKNKPFV